MKANANNAHAGCGHPAYKWVVLIILVMAGVVRAQESYVTAEGYDNYSVTISGSTDTVVVAAWTNFVTIGNITPAGVTNLVTNTEWFVAQTVQNSNTSTNTVQLDDGLDMAAGQPFNWSWPTRTYTNHVCRVLNGLTAVVRVHREFYFVPVVPSYTQ